MKLTASLTSFTPATYSTSGTLTCNAAYKHVMWFDHYDRWGNLLQCHEEDGLPISFVYEYDHSIATAQITGGGAHDGRGGVSLNEVFYTSFENDPLATVIEAKTGKKARRGPIVIPSGHFKPATKYLVTWWGSLDGGKNWQPNRDVISELPFDGFTVGTAAHYVDEVSIIPEDASISTSTWIPGIGKTSEGDGNGSTTYYRYDAFGRPTGILNNRKETTHSYQY